MKKKRQFALTRNRKEKPNRSIYSGKITNSKPVILANKDEVLGYAKSMGWITAFLFIFFAFTIVLTSQVSAQAYFNTSQYFLNYSVAYYKLDNSTLDSVAGRNLSNYNCTTIVGQFINMSCQPSRWTNTTHSFSSITSANGWSISFWVKRTGTISNFPSFYGNEIGSVDANGETKAFSNGQDIDIYMRDSVSLKTLDGNNLGLNTWDFEVITYDGTTAYLWQNNTLVTNQILTSFNNSANGYPIQFFGSNLANNITNVVFDEIGFWNKTLNASDINMLYNNSEGFTYPFYTPFTTTPSNTTTGNLQVDFSTGNDIWVFAIIIALGIFCYIYVMSTLAGMLMFLSGLIAFKSVTSDGLRVLSIVVIIIGIVMMVKPYKNTFELGVNK